jgi:hypothetical protein
MNKRQRRVCGRWLALACLAGSVGRLGVAGLTAQWSPDPDWRGGAGASAGPATLIQCGAVQCGAVQCGAVRYSTQQYSTMDAKRCE